MTDEQKTKCHAIIHSCALAAAGGNAVPVPGLGIAVDTIAMTSMAVSLSAMLGGSIAEDVAKALAVAALKNTILKQPIKQVVKELGKFIPVVGQVVSPGISIMLIEAAGWALAGELESKIRDRTL